MYLPKQQTNTTTKTTTLPMANTTREVLHGHNQQQERPKQAKHQWNPSLRNEDTSLISLPQEQCTHIEPLK